ncbi:MAG TPA: class A beta-lactamase, partial [Longimicrobium sp.]|nr:class A beta-lactamase [Longimicrobium sp.]
ELKREFARIAAESGGTVGVAAVHVESGTRVAVRGGERFPMQSVYKFPIALAVLGRVDEGRLSLDSMIAVRPADLRFGASPISDEVRRGTQRFTVRELLRRMVSESDNTASDRLLALAGGPAAVTANLRRLGINGVRVDRSEGRLGLDFNGVPYVPTREAVDSARRFIAAMAPAPRATAIERYLADPRDTATPDAMTDLLVLLHRTGAGLRPASRALLVRWMTETPTGANRIRNLLPAGTVVVHKTGTSQTVDGMTAAVNDVGLVSLPDGSHLALAVFVKHGARGTEAAERAIARIARAAFEHQWPTKSCCARPR